MKKSVQSSSSFEEFDDVWDAIESGPREAALSRAKCDLVLQIHSVVAENPWSAAEAAARCGLEEDHYAELERGDFSNFSLEELVTVATVLGRKVRVEIEAA